MNSDQVRLALQGIASSDDFVALSGDLTDRLSTEPDAFSAVEPILRFMESHPELDYGMPGALVHFVEGFFGHGYEQLLLESVRRKPTPHTVWMLNRVINGVKSPEGRRPFLAVLGQAAENTEADSETRRQASHFLARQTASS